jgi:uncharacterized protein (TIGR00299 family) protein
MILGALVDAGLSVDELRSELSGLRLPGYRLSAERVQRAGLAATRVHDDVESGDLPHRRLGDVLEIINGSDLPTPDKDRGVRIFSRLADAEAAVHGTSTDEVHFHEVGAIDAILDVMGAVVALRLAGIDACHVSPVPAGSGSARSAHGMIPVPGPATLALLAGSGAVIREDAGERGELVTPTAAAILTTLGQFSRPAMTLDRIGYGAGSRDPAGMPNVLRIWIGRGDETPGRRLLEVETNIDDMPAEQFGYVQERLFAAGALDVWFTPAQMKKNRPATVLSLLCTPAAEASIVDLLFRETSTLGLRMWEVRRHEAERQSLTFVSSLGDVSVKIKRLAGERPRVAPEYDSCREVALRTGLPLPEVYRIISAEAEAHVT